LWTFWCFLHTRGIHNFRYWWCHLYNSCSRVKQLWKYSFLQLFIWCSVSGLVWFCDGPNSGCASIFVKISEKVWQRPWQWSDKHWEKKA
jgi:hypothetical protein